MIERCESRLLGAPRHSIIFGRIRNVMLGAGVALMIAVASAGAPVIGDAADALNLRGSLPGRLLLVVNTAGSIVVFAAIYRWAPRATLRWRSAIIGAMPAVVAIQAIPALVGLYVGNFVGFAAVRLFLILAIVLLGLYVMANVLLIGSGLAVKRELRYARRATRRVQPRRPPAAPVPSLPRSDRSPRRSPSPPARRPVARPLPRVHRMRPACSTTTTQTSRLLDGKTVAIIGFGSQGHAHALNLKDSGGRRRRRPARGLLVRRRRRARRGLEVLPVAEAASRGDIVMVLVPDELHHDVYENEVRDGIADGNLLLFGHGFSIHYGEVEPPPGVDVGARRAEGPRPPRAPPVPRGLAASPA